MPPLGFKPEWAALFDFSLRSTSGAILADLFAAGAQPVTFPHAYAQVVVGLDSNR